MTSIFCTAKLKKFLQPALSAEIPLAVGEQWNANLFYINKRKCIAFLHKESIYVVVLFDVLKKDLAGINKLFADAFVQQLYSDGILEPENELLVRNQIGKIYFRPTDNDRSALGSLNDTIYRLTYWNYLGPDAIERTKKYSSFHINETPLGSRKYEDAKTLMKQKIEDIAKGNKR